MEPDQSRNRSVRRRRGRPTVPVVATTIALLLFVVAIGLWASGYRLGGSEDGGTTSRSEGTAALGPRDGYVPVGGSLSPFSHAPAVANLKPDLRAALHRAATDARADGVQMRVDGGWRSPRYQRELLRRAVVTYGSLEVARRYVLPPSESSHVTGEAVDIGPTAADSWLSQHGAEYGLCQTYANELWHFQLATTPGGACPAAAPDAAAGQAPSPTS